VKTMKERLGNIFDGGEKEEALLLYAL